MTQNVCLLVAAVKSPNAVIISSSGFTIDYQPCFVVVVFPGNLHLYCDSEHAGMYYT